MEPGASSPVMSDQPSPPNHWLLNLVLLIFLALLALAAWFLITQ